MFNPLSIRSWLILSIFLTAFTGCGGGGERVGFQGLPDLSLTGMSIEGADLFLSGDRVTEFDPNQTGPYTASVENSVTSMNFSVTFEEQRGVEVQAYRYFENEDGNTEIDRQTLTSGQQINFALAEGDNTFHVHVRESSNGSRVIYRLEVSRVSTSANLGPMQFLVAGSSKRVGNAENLDAFIASDDEIAFLENETVTDVEGNTSTVTWPTSLNFTDTEYTFVAKYPICDVSIRVSAEAKHASISFNGESVLNHSLNSIPLMLGENEFSVSIESENGANQRDYSFRIIRVDGTESELNEDNLLSSLAFSSGRMGDFRCNQRSYVNVVRNDQPSVTMLLDTDTTQSTIQMGPAELDDDGAPVLDRVGRNDFDYVVLEENLFDVQAGVSFPNDTASTEDDDVLNLELGNNYFVIEVTVVVNGSSRKEQYIVNLFRTDTNWIEVSTTEELQAALQGVQPNEEIIVNDGVYEGIMGLANSGHEDAFFYSAQSGTQEQPIVLRAGTAGNVILRGSGEDVGSVLRIEGDYWQIRDFFISDGLTGIQLNGASNNVVKTTVISYIGGAAVSLENGSVDNSLTFLNISDSGLVENRGAVVIGGVGEPSTGNQLWNSLIGENVSNELVVVSEDAEGTDIAFNMFDFADFSESTVEQSVFSLAADNTVFQYNDISVNPVPVVGLIDSVISVNGQADGVASIFGNVFSLSNYEVDLVSDVGSGVRLDIDNNVRSDDVAPSYQGAGVNENIITDLYQIESVSDSGQCLTNQTIQIDTDTGEGVNLQETDVVLLAPCAQAEGQVWRLANDGEGYVTIELVSGDVSTARLVYTTSDIIESVLVVDEIAGDVFDEGFTRRWRFTQDDENGLNIYNKYLSTYAISTATLSEYFITEQKGLVIEPFNDEDEFRFNLIPVN